MALLCVILSVAAPSLARSFHQRNLTQEALRLLAVTEYARDEATSKGIPMVVWIDVDGGRYGVKPKAGYEDAGARSKDYTLTEGVSFEGSTTAKAVAGESDAAEFEPDGTLDPSSQTAVRLVDRSNSMVSVSQTKDAWGYEIEKAAQ